MKLQQAKQLLLSGEKEMAEIRDKGYETVFYKGREITVKERTKIFNKMAAGIRRRLNGHGTVCDVK